MHATDVKAIAEASRKETSPAEKDTAARMAALMHHVFLYDRGNQLRVIEETGLSITQCKALLELGGLGNAAEAWQVSDLAELFGVSVPSMSRAVDALVKAKLASRVEDPNDRRARQVKITAKGKSLVATLVTVRLTGIESFVATLSAAQRRKLDAAVEALMDREDLSQTYEHLKGSDRS
ncbi:MAG TPA: MarR family transcriptional regulator [Solirubrobacterales bacterium]|jgi:DNA-binding MarR family transcriptional regulator|nr:MarR family transcriptional regulator [Solirubrobacterales bacterium]